MFRWADHVDADHVRRVQEAYDEVASRVAGLRRHVHVVDAGVSAGSFDFHVVADFDSLTDWRAYRDHPAHVLLVHELLDGFVAESAGGQFVLPDDDASRPAPTDESDEELLARARRAAMAGMEALLAEPDDV